MYALMLKNLICSKDGLLKKQTQSCVNICPGSLYYWDSKRASSGDEHTCLQKGPNGGHGNAWMNWSTCKLRGRERQRMNGLEAILLLTARFENLVLRYLNSLYFTCSTLNFWNVSVQALWSSVCNSHFCGSQLHMYIFFSFLSGGIFWFPFAEFLHSDDLC